MGQETGFLKSGFPKIWSEAHRSRSQEIRIRRRCRRHRRRRRHAPTQWAH